STVEIIDLNSKNHTFVNGREVSRATLHDGTVLRIGNTLFVLRLERPQCADAPRAERPLHERLLGQAQAICGLRHALGEVVRLTEPVLLAGPTGAGKELAAAGVHSLSSRSRRPFIPVNCAAIPSGAVESALFGHRRGAFTNAERDHDGYFK